MRGQGPSRRAPVAPAPAACSSGAIGSARSIPLAIRLERHVIFVELAERADRRQDRGAPAEALAEYAAKLARGASRRDEDGGIGQR